jgi:hypothetical protein
MGEDGDGEARPFSSLSLLCIASCINNIRGCNYKDRELMLQFELRRRIEVEWWI